MNISTKKIKFVTKWLALYPFISRENPYLESIIFCSITLENDSFVNKLEKVQYQTWLAIAVSFQGKSSESLYKELGLGSLKWLMV